MPSPLPRLPRPSPYRWAVGAQGVSPGQTVGDRYIVISTRVWRDTQPNRSTPELFTAEGTIADEGLLAVEQDIVPYGRLRQLRYAAIQAHLPGLETVVQLEGQPVLLLCGGVDLVGQPHPTLPSVWKQSSPVQQLTWLWQLCFLWEALQAEGVATSLLQSDNLRIDGDRLCVMSLQTDDPESPTPASLGRLWLPWTIYMGDLAAPLQNIAHTLQTAADLEGLFSAEYQINRLLLQATARPMVVEAKQATAAAEPTPRSAASYGKIDGLPLAAVCSGPIASNLPHPVAAQLIQSLAIQVTVMGEELERCGLLSPRWVVPQLLAMVRVLNNMLLAQESRARLSFGFAVAIPQPVDGPHQPDDDQKANSTAHDIYLFTTGNCFAYQSGEDSWTCLAPMTVPTSFLGESSEALEGQIRRLTVDRDQALLLSTYPLEECLNRQATDSASNPDGADVVAVAQWIEYKTAAKSSEAIAVLHYQQEPVSPAVPPDLAEVVSPAPMPPAPTPVNVERESAAPDTPEPPPVEPASQPASQPAFQLETPETLGDDHSDRGVSFEELDQSLTGVKPDIDDSIGSYLDAEVQAPQPVPNTILDRDIDHGLSTLLPESLSEPVPPSEPVLPSEPAPPSEPVPSSEPAVKTTRRHPSTDRARSKPPKRGSTPKRQKPRRRAVGQRNVNQRRTNQNRVDQNRVNAKRTSKKRRASQRSVGQQTGIPWLLLTLLLLLVAAGVVVGLAVWQHYDTEQIQRWLSQGQSQQKVTGKRMVE